MDDSAQWTLQDSRVNESERISSPSFLYLVLGTTVRSISGSSRHSSPKSSSVFTQYRCASSKNNTTKCANNTTKYARTQLNQKINTLQYKKILRIEESQGKLFKWLGIPHSPSLFSLQLFDLHADFQSAFIVESSGLLQMLDQLHCRTSAICSMAHHLNRLHIFVI